jgi:SAM-dependent methyltransferase
MGALPMKTTYEKVYHQLEKEHFWFKARRKYILNAVAEANRNSRILDIGCSSGILLHELIQLGFNKENMFGVDISAQAIDNCKASGLENTYVMDAQHISLNEQFDIIIASDCLEHLKEDETALKNWRQLLKPDGTAYIFVPAFMSLWSNHDVVNMHYRRYGRKELNEKLRSNGFRIQESGFWNVFLFLPIFVYRWISKLIPTRKSGTGNLDKLPPFNKLLIGLLSFENQILRHIRFPFGVSCYVFVKKS